MTDGSGVLIIPVLPYIFSFTMKLSLPKLHKWAAISHVTGTLIFDNQATQLPGCCELSHHCTNPACII